MKTKVRNKYKIKPFYIRRMEVVNWDRLKEIAYYHQAKECWVIDCNTIKEDKDILTKKYNTFELRFYEKGANKYPSKIQLDCRFGNGKEYKFNNFFDSKDITEDIDLEIQEKLLSILNMLLDDKILVLQSKKGYRCLYGNTRNRKKIQTK